MPKANCDDLLLFLYHACGTKGGGDKPDSALLEQFLAHEEAAFSMLVKRHGALIWGLCRRLSEDIHAAEDCFQATFMVLVRRAASIRKKDSIAPWLCGVARRVIAKARAKAEASRRRERKSMKTATFDPLQEMTVRELRACLDEVIATLPEKYQTPILLCYFEGKSHNEAAKELGLPKNTVSKRLTRGLELLGGHLKRRGISLTAAALAAALNETVGATPLPAALAIKTVKSALLLATGKTMAGGCLSAGALALTEEVVTGMLVAKGKMVLMVLALGLAVGGAGWAGYQGIADPGQTNQANGNQKGNVQIRQRGEQEEKPHLDSYGDPLPEGAVARLGTARFRHEGRASRLAYTPDGKSLVGTTNSGVLIWDAATGTERYRLPAPLSRDDAGMDISPDGTILAIATVARENEETKVNLWQLQSGKKTASLSLPSQEGVGARIHQIIFSSDRKYLALTSKAKAYVFDLATGQVCMSFGGREKSQGFYNIAVSPDSKTLAAAVQTYGPNAADQSHGIQIWDIAMGTWVRLIHNLPEMSSSSIVTAIAFAPAGSALAFGNEKCVFLFDPRTGTQLGQFDSKLGSIQSLVFTPDGKKLLASGYWNAAIHVWDMAAGKLLDAPEGTLISDSGSMALSPDGKTVALGGGTHNVKLWDMDAGSQLFTEYNGHNSQINALAFSPDGKKLISACDRRIFIWDAATWKQSALPCEKAPLWEFARSLSFSPDGKQLALLRAPKGARVPRALIWNVDKAEYPRVLGVPDSEDVLSATFSADGRKLFMLDWKWATSDGDRTIRHRVRHWDVATGTERQKWTIPPLQSRQPFLSPDGKTVFSALDNGSVGICDAKSGRERLLRGQEEQRLIPLSCSPDSRMLASGIKRTSEKLGPYTDLRLSEVLTGKEVLVLRGQQDNVATAAWSPDGRLIASGASRLFTHYSGSEIPVAHTAWDVPKSVRLWDTASGQVLACYDNIKTDVTALTFSPDGKSLVAGLRDSTLLVFDVTEAIAKSRRSPKLGSDELEGLWTALAKDNASTAHQALWTLVSAPKKAVPFLRDLLKPVVTADATQIQQWITDLDSDQFAARQNAAKELGRLGEQVQDPIKKALKANIPLETRRRLEQILNNLAEVPSPETVRTLRAIMALERIGTAEARSVLETLARGVPGARETEEAKGSLERLTKRVARLP